MKEKIQETLTQARAIRRFDETRPIANEDWQLLLEVARQAPSSQGREPWGLIQVESREVRQELSAIAPGMTQQLATAPKFVFFTSQTAQALPQDANLERLAQALVLSDAAALTAWSQRQAYIPLGQMLLAAGLMGIDCCPMEGLDIAAASEILTKAGALKPQEEVLTVAAAFGYRVSSPEQAKKRRPLQEFLKII